MRADWESSSDLHSAKEQQVEPLADDLHTEFNLSS